MANPGGGGEVRWANRIGTQEVIFQDGDTTWSDAASKRGGTEVPP